MIHKTVRYGLFLLSFFVLFHLDSANSYEESSSIGEESKTEFVDYKTAKKKVKEAGLKTVKEYDEWQKQHPDMPPDPYQTYKYFWEDWSSFLGNDDNYYEESDTIWDYEEAKKNLSELGVKTVIEYNILRRKHEFYRDVLPEKPWKYWDKFETWQDLLDVEDARPDRTPPKPVADLRSEIDDLDVEIETMETSKKKKNPNKLVDKTAKKKSSTGGNTNIKRRQGGPRSLQKKFVDYHTAQKRAQVAGIKSAEQYIEWQKQHPDIPSNPNITYKGKGWISLYSFLGTEPQTKFVDYHTAQARAQAAGIKTYTQYIEWQKQHPDIPSNPNITYKGKGWISLYSFLGTGFVDYHTAQARAQAAGIKTSTQYKEWQKQHPDIPVRPEITYKGKGWISFPSFLGTASKTTKLVDYETAKKKVQAAGIKTYTQYMEWQKQHADMPVRPDITYKDEGWISYPSFLGTASKRVRSVGIKSSRENKGRKKQAPNISAHPNSTHKKKSRKCSQIFEN